MSTYTWVAGLSGDWSNAADWSGGVPNDPTAIAAISAPGAYTVTIGSTEQFTVASLSLAGSDAILRIDGALSASGTVTVTRGSGMYLDGTISGGTIADLSGGISYAGGTLSGVAYQGTLDMSSDNSTLTITGPTSFVGSGGVGAGTINLSEPSSGYGVSSLLNVLGTETLSNVTIDIGNSRFDSPVTTLENLDTSGTGAVLTLGPSCTIVQTAGFAAISSSGFAGDMIVNDGKIKAAYAGGHLYIDADFFTNNGTMSVSNGAFIDLSGSISAGLVNSIHKSGGFVAIDGTVTGGTITAPTGGVDGFGEP